VLMTAGAPAAVRPAQNQPVIGDVAPDANDPIFKDSDPDGVQFP